MKFECKSDYQDILNEHQYISSIYYAFQYFHYIFLITQPLGSFASFPL